MTIQQKNRIKALGVIALHTAIYDLRSIPHAVALALLRIYQLEKCTNLRYLQAMTGWFKNGKGNI